MKHRYTNKYTSNNLNDWIIHCDICGKPVWYSQAILLSPTTGRGGLLVCSNDADTIDYGLVPYTIPIETTPTNTRINSVAYTDAPETVYSAFNSALYDPMLWNPDQLDQLGLTWNNMTTLTWDNYTVLNWGQLL